jgi:lipoprotein-anchoring transpeptidase ErfK/SrfK
LSAANNSPSLPVADTKATSSKAFENAKQLATEQASQGKLKEALATMSVLYNATDLSSSQRTDLVDMLDALAGEVIYSQEHYLEIPYFTAPGETMEQIAKRFEVPTEVLARINGLDATSPLQQGTKLKVIPGPFRAEVDLNRNELTLFLGELYASRFPISTGIDPNPQPGNYSVLTKDRNRNYYSVGNAIPGNDPRNPYGGYWIDLGNSVCIHGASDSNAEKLGCISLAPHDIADVFGMLGSGANVTIRR